MTPRDEGYQAAKDGQYMSACPYIYSKMDISMARYIMEHWDEKRAEWIKGWRAYHEEHHSTTL